MGNFYYTGQIALGETDRWEDLAYLPRQGTILCGDAATARKWSLRLNKKRPDLRVGYVLRPPTPHFIEVNAYDGIPIPFEGCSFDFWPSLTVVVSDQAEHATTAAVAVSALRQGGNVAAGYQTQKHLDCSQIAVSAFNRMRRPEPWRFRAGMIHKSYWGDQDPLGIANPSMVIFSVDTADNLTLFMPEYTGYPFYPVVVCAQEYNGELIQTPWGRYYPSLYMRVERDKVVAEKVAATWLEDDYDQD